MKLLLPTLLLSLAGGAALVSSAAGHGKSTAPSFGRALQEHEAHREAALERALEAAERAQEERERAVERSMAQAERAADQALEEVERQLEQAQRQSERELEAAERAHEERVRAIERAMREAERAAAQAHEQVERQLDRARLDAERAMERAEAEAERATARAEQEAERAMQQALRQAGRGADARSPGRPAPAGFLTPPSPPRAPVPVHADGTTCGGHHACHHCCCCGGAGSAPGAPRGDVGLFTPFEFDAFGQAESRDSEALEAEIAAMEAAFASQAEAMEALEAAEGDWENVWEEQARMLEVQAREFEQQMLEFEEQMRAFETQQGGWDGEAEQLFEDFTEGLDDLGWIEITVEEDAEACPGCSELDCSGCGEDDDDCKSCEVSSDCCGEDDAEDCCAGDEEGCDDGDADDDCDGSDDEDRDDGVVRLRRGRAGDVLTGYVPLPARGVGQRLALRPAFSSPAPQPASWRGLAAPQPTPSVAELAELVEEMRRDMKDLRGELSAVRDEIRRRGVSGQL